MKNTFKQVCPPILWKFLANLKTSLKIRSNSYASYSKSPTSPHSDHQDLDIYWDDEMAKLLDTWGEGNVWNEIQFLLANCEGRVLDIACGTGKTIEMISKFPNIEVYGVDISDLLIGKAIERGISDTHLKVGDATSTNYLNNFFKYSYSIGSLEHFSNEGILQFITESYRVTEIASFHQIPVSRNGKDEGWIKSFQSYHNNSVDWWLSKFNLSYPNVYVIDSIWSDEISLGKWFICHKNSDKGNNANVA